MSISSELRRTGLFECDGTTKTFPFGFKIFNVQQLAVWLADEDGNESRADVTTYSVTLNADQDNNPGGSVTLTTAPASGNKLVILSDVDYLQELVLTNRGAFLPSSVNDSLDKATIQIQQLKEQLDRVLKVGPTGTEATAERLMALIREALETYDKIKNALVYRRAAWTLSSDVTFGSIISIPNNIAYTVGNNQLLVFWNGMGLSEGAGKNYREVGNVGNTSTQIQVLFDMHAGDELLVWYSPLGGS